MRQLTEIIVHCTATRPEWWATRTAKQKVAEVKKWHTSPPKNWRDVGYHYLIDRDGTVVEGRLLDADGAHVEGRNKGTVGIALFGGHGSNKTDAFEAHFTPEQDTALRELIARLKTNYPSIKTVSGHNQYANRACPGFSVPVWYAHKQPPAERTSPAQSTTLRAAGAQIGTTLLAGGPVIGALDGMAQIAAIVMVGLIALTSIWIFRERLRKWKEGDR